MFEKTLTDVVKGIRASKRDTSKYISQCIAEIKVELNSSDMFVKANALQKLTFLQMMGFSMNWDRASFTTIEVMSSPRFAHKRVGYLAAVWILLLLLLPFLALTRSMHRSDHMCCFLFFFALVVTIESRIYTRYRSSSIIN
jgi:Adaptin N terminal region